MKDLDSRSCKAFLSFVFLMLLLFVPFMASSSALTDQNNIKVITLVSPNYQQAGYFGISVATNGKIAVVGAYVENYNHGRVYIFNASNGKLLMTLVNPNPKYEGNFGYSLALSGTTLVVGAFADTVKGEVGAGSAYVFNATTGALISNLTNPDPQYAAFFGAAVAISGKTAVIGAPEENINGTAYVFNAANGALLHIIHRPNKDYRSFGGTVATNSKVAVIGGGNYVFVYNAGTGRLMANLTGADYAGASIAINDRYLLVGAAQDVGKIHAAGRVFVYRATKPFTLIGNLTSPHAQSMGLFGSSISVSGTELVIGAAGEWSGGHQYAGNAYVFTNVARGNHSIEITSQNPEYNGEFGYTVGISGTVAIAGAPQETVNGQTYAGRAYVFVNV